VPELLSRWDVVLVIVTLLTLFGMIVNWVVRLTKPINALSKTTIQLAKCVEVLNDQLDKHIIQNNKEYEKLLENIEKHDGLLQQHSTDIAILKEQNGKKG